MVEVDGDDGGGQILRTSLTLAMLTGKAVTVEGGPAGERGGSLRPRGALDAPLELAATGGTDVKWSPPLSFCRRVKLPLLRAHGLAAAVTRPRVRGPQRPAGGR
jgi:RNA 3'-terminal phosphate cyclase (ATP)